MTNEERESPLEKLLVPEELDEQFLYEVLDPYVKFHRESGDIIFREAFEQADARERVLVGLLAHTARYELGYESRKWVEIQRLAKQINVTASRILQELEDLEDHGLNISDGRSVTISYSEFEKVKQLCKALHEQIHGND